MYIRAEDYLIVFTRHRPYTPHILPSIVRSRVRSAPPSVQTLLGESAGRPALRQGGERPEEEAEARLVRGMRALGLIR